MNRIYKKLGIWIAVFVMSPISIFAATSYTVNNGSAPSVTEWSACKVITNNSGKQLFIPTKTSPEWSSFYGHPPGGVGISTCCVPSGTNHNGCYNNQMWAIDSCNSPQYVMDGCAGNFCSDSNHIVSYIGCSGDLNGGTCTTPNSTYCPNGCTNGSCNACAGNYGQSCQSGANACGQVGYSTYDCNGNCSATAPNGWCNTCQSPAANTWYVDYFVYTFGYDSSCNDGWYGNGGTVAGEYWTWVEPNHAALTNSIDTGNSCFWFSGIGEYARAYGRSPIYDNGGSWYYNNCGVCGGGGSCN